MNLSTMRVGLSGIFILGVMAWGAPTGSASDSDSPTAIRGITGGAVATCEADVIGQGPDDWRSSMKSAGPLAVRKKPLQTGVSKAPGRNWFQTKLPLLVAGHDPVTLSVPPGMKGRVRLNYDRRHPNAERGVTFIPCTDKPRTYWGGGIRVKGRRPVKLLVTVAEKPPAHVLALGPPRPVPEPR